MTARAGIADDASAEAAIDRAFAGMTGVRPITDLASMESTLSPDDRLVIVDQALIVLERLYSHLHMKRIRHAIDPVQALRNLRSEARTLSDGRFHAAMLRIFKSLRDIHTAYTAPPPYARLTAFLPFLMEPCAEQDGRTRYLVTRVLKGFDHPTFRPGVEIETWHGAPVARAVERQARVEEGANPASQLALGNLFMTVRWLGACLVPDEDWVILGYRHPGGTAEIRLPWSLLELEDESIRFAFETIRLFEKASSPAGATDLNQALNVRTHVEQLSRRELFVRADAKQRATAPGLVSNLPRLLEAQRLADPESGESYGYIRMRAFEHDDVGAFVDEFRRLLALMPRRGLILDIRGNPGGVVRCAESLLQLLVPKTITPLPFQFPATDLTIRLSAPPGDLPVDRPASFGAMFERRLIASAWGAGITVARETGALFSGGVPLTPVDEANRYGQEYFGPVVLIVDAITYSAGDIFAAGFQDHGIGPVLGVDVTTGAGGANVWAHDHLVEIFPDVPEIRPLPGGAKLRVAARRCGRTGPSAGLPIEEVGIRADACHALTEADIVDDNRDLKAAAIRLLAERPAVWLDAAFLADGDERSIEIAATGIDRVVVYVDGRPLTSSDVTDGRPFVLPLPAGWAADRVEVNGFARGDRVACRRLACPAPPAA